MQAQGRFAATQSGSNCGTPTGLIYFVPFRGANTPIEPLIFDLSEAERITAALNKALDDGAASWPAAIHAVAESAVFGNKISATLRQSAEINKGR